MSSALTANADTDAESLAGVDAVRKAAFERLQPLCIALVQLRSPLIERLPAEQLRRLTLRKLDDFMDVLVSIEHPELSMNASIVDYALYPLFSLMHSTPYEKLSEALVERVLRCIYWILAHRNFTSSFRTEMYGQMLALLTLWMGGLPESVRSKLTMTLSEDIKMLATHALVLLLPASEPGVLASESFRLRVGHLIFVLLENARDERMLKLRLESLLALNTLLVNYLFSPDILCNYLPGISSTLNKILLRDPDKENHKLLIAALQLLTTTLVCTLSSEANLHLLKSSTTSSNEQIEQQSSTTQGMRMTIRSWAWLQSSISKVEFMLCGLSAFRIHGNQAVRDALYSMCKKLLQQCKFILTPKTRVWLLECLFTTGQVPDHLEMKVEIDASILSAFSTAIEQCRRCFAYPDIRKLELLNIVSGYVVVLGQQHLIVTATVDKLLFACLKLISINLTNDKIVQVSVSVDQPASFPAFTYTYISDPTVLEAISNLVQRVLTSISADILLTRLQRGLDREETEVQALLLLNYAVSESTVHSVLKIHTALLSTATMLRGRLSHKEIVRMSLAIQGIGLGAQILQYKFAPYLIDYLFLLLGHYASENELISMSAAKSLSLIAESMGQSSIESLCCYNIDYIVNTATHRLRFVYLNPLICRVIGAIVNLIGADRLHLLSDTIEEILELMRVHQQDENIMKELLSVLAAYVRAVPLYSNTVSPLLLSILQNVRHFLSAASSIVRQHAIQLAIYLIPPLHKHSKELNPLIFPLFSNLNFRLEDTEPFLVIETLQLVATLVKYSPDFAGNHVRDLVLPKAMQLLVSPVVNRTSQAHKVFVAVLQTLLVTIEAIKLPTNSAYSLSCQLIDALTRFSYLNDGRVDGDGKVVTTLLEECLRKIIVFRSDAVWTALAPIIARSNSVKPGVITWIHDDTDFSVTIPKTVWQNQTAHIPDCLRTLWELCCDTPSPLEMYM